MTMLLDSGSSRSILLASNARPPQVAPPPLMKRYALREGIHAGRDLDLGSVEFAVPEAVGPKLNPELTRRLTSDGIAGILGIDFFEHHDVLVDYARRRVFVSQYLAKPGLDVETPEISLRPLPGSPIVGPSGPARWAPLAVVPSGSGQYSLVTLVQGDKATGDTTMTLPLLDTGAGSTSVVASAIHRTRPPGASAAKMLCYDKTVDGWYETLRLSIGGMNQPIQPETFIGDVTQPAVSPKDLCGQVLFVLGQCAAFLPNGTSRRDRAFRSPTTTRTAGRA
jgi:hypothetical protein